ncbi:MAG: permease, partial [Pseudomonadota bacterium]
MNVATVTSTEVITRSANKLVCVWTLIVLIPLLVWAVDPERLAQILGIATSALISTSIYIAFAVLMIGYLKATGAESV